MSRMKIARDLSEALGTARVSRAGFGVLAKTNFSFYRLAHSIRSDSPDSPYKKDRSFLSGEHNERR